MRPRMNTMRQRGFRPALPELKAMLVETATAQAEKAGSKTLGARAPAWLPRLLGPRRLAIGAAVVGVAAGLLILSGGRGVGVRAERADAADLSRLAAIAPHLQLIGQWQITSTEVSPSGGRIQFHSEEDGPHAFSTKQAEIQWHSASLAERAQQLESAGFAFAGAKRMEIIRPYVFVTGELDRYGDVKLAQVYVSHEDGQKGFEAAGLWREGGRTFEYRAIVPSFSMLEGLMERIGLLSSEEWFVALRPGGGRWLAETASGTAKNVVKVKVGETADGQPVYRDHALLGAPEPGEKLDFEAPLPTVYREGDKIKVVTQQPPADLG